MSALPTLFQLLCIAAKDPMACASIGNQETTPLPINSGSDGLKSLPICVISDQERLSVLSGELNTWHSTLLMGRLHVNEHAGFASIEWSDSYNYTSSFAYKGRAMELSDLKAYGGGLLSVDDRTGLVYKLNGKTAVPWVYLADGDGSSPQPYKPEWITIRDGLIYIGGLGRETTTESGSFVNDLPLYVKTVDSQGAVTSIWWGDKFRKLRAAIEIEFPGFVVHESCQWSPVHRRWFFLPRQASKVAYDKLAADQAGTNVLLSATDDFDNIKVTRIGEAEPARGFSAFQFVPGLSFALNEEVAGTNDTLIVALKSVEEKGLPKQSFFTVFNVHGEILLDETPIPGNYKFEGVEFYDWSSVL